VNSKPAEKQGRKTKGSKGANPRQPVAENGSFDGN